MQGMECGAVQALLRHPALVEAVHYLIKPYSRAVPALAMPIQELARRLCQRCVATVLCAALLHAADAH